MASQAFDSPFRFSTEVSQWETFFVQAVELLIAQLPEATRNLNDFAHPRKQFLASRLVD